MAPSSPNPPGLHSVGQVSWEGKELQLSVNTDDGYQPPTSPLGMFRHSQSLLKLS